MFVPQPCSQAKVYAALQLVEAYNFFSYPYSVDDCIFSSKACLHLVLLNTENKNEFIK